MATNNSAVGTYIANVLAASGDIAQLEFAAGVSDIALTLAGTFVGTVQFEIGLANLTTGITWTALTCNPIPTGSGVTSATAVGTWSAAVAGFTHFRFRCSAYTSGRIYATVNAALAADGGGVISSGSAHQTAIFASASSIKGVATGTSGQVLTSNGASTDPSFQDAGGGAPGGDPGQLQYQVDASTFGGVPGSSWDGTDFNIDITGGGGELDLASAGGMDFTDNSATAGIGIIEQGNAPVQIGSAGNGNVSFGSVGGTTRLFAKTSTLDLDDTVDGVVTIDTILNAIGGLQTNGNRIYNLLGTSSAIGGSALILGQQATTTVSIAGASAAIAAGAVIVVSPVGDVGSGFIWTGSLTASDTITVKVICLVAGTPASLAYNVKVI